MSLISDMKRLSDRALSSVKRRTEARYKGTPRKTRPELEIAFNSLKFRNERARRSLARSFPALRAYKQVAIGNELTADMDREILTAYHRSDGIEFFALELIDFCDGLSWPPYDVDYLIAGGYNGAIGPMLSILDTLEAKLAELREQLDAIPQKYSSPAAVWRTVGYTDLSQRFETLRRIIRSKSVSPESPERLLSELGELVRRNEAAAEQARRCEEEGITRAGLKYDGLLSDMRDALRMPYVGRMSDAESWDSESYINALVDYSRGVKKYLLDRHRIFADGHPDG